MVQRNTSTETQRRRHTAPTRNERERHQNDSQDDEIHGVRTIEVSHKMTRLEIKVLGANFFVFSCQAGDWKIESTVTLERNETDMTSHDVMGPLGPTAR